MTIYRRLGGLVGALALVAAACGSGGGGDGPATRQVLVDYSHDAFAGYFISYFPSEVIVRQGDTVRFVQAWNGEPHSVTLGTKVDEMMEVITPLLERYGDVPEEEVPQEAFQQFSEAEEGLPFAYGDEDDLNQTAAQPCYLRSEEIPTDGRPCSEAQQRQPEFDGSYSYYNSGIIPYRGTDGNEFEVKLADDLDPGTYAFYCNVHGAFQNGTIEVREQGSDIPSESEVSRRGLAEAREQTDPLDEAFDELKAGRGEIGGERITGNIAGWFVEAPDINGAINEFVPKTIEARVGEKVTWKVIGGHTISFGDVPSYDAQFRMAEDGTVSLNPSHYEPQGGWPGMPEHEDEGDEGPPGEEGSSEGGPPSEEDDGPPPEVSLDAGTWDGDGFVSSGVVFGEGSPLLYSVTFSKAGTYDYACLIHPRMVGKVTVR